MTSAIAKGTPSPVSRTVVALVRTAQAFVTSTILHQQLTEGRGSVARKIILCDMDGILADMHGAVIKLLKSEYDIDFKRSQFTHHDFGKCLPIEDKIWRHVNEDGWFDRLQPIPGAISGLAQLYDSGAQIVIATSPTRNASSAKEKKEWLAKHAPFLKPRNTMIGALKHLLKGDFLIDDSADQQKNYRKAWPDSTILTIRYPAGADKGVDVIADGYDDSIKAWNTIVKEVLARL